LVTLNIFRIGKLCKEIFLENNITLFGQKDQVVKEAAMPYFSLGFSSRWQMIKK
jgi:hypothetical protein